tara:strand:+ start:939 stop:1121 length:183 start_codon:yes stop_codon:yes gene_type:complete
MKFKCGKCKKEKELYKYISVLRSGKLIAKEFKCICGNYMKEILTEDHKGMPTIIRNESSK